MGVILIAFERESEQNALEQLLTARKHRVVRSDTGLAALDAARRDPPDLIVCDIVLPRMDGFALCRRWKQDERLRSVPFVFYTSRHNDPKYERFALELGAERFLARSAPPQTLADTVDELLGGLPARSAPAVQPTGNGQSESTTASSGFEKRPADERSGRSQQELARLDARLESLEVINERLSASEARFRQLFEANPLPMWIADIATDGFIAVNDAALALFGYTRAQFLSRKAAALLLPGTDDASAVRMHQRKDGVALALATATRRIEFDGRSADLVSAYDLSERLAQELRLREQSGSGRAALQAAADGCWVLDADGRIVDVNNAYCSMSGYSRDELLKMTAAEIEDRTVGETTNRLQLERASGGGRYEMRHRRRDGGLMDVEVSVGSLTDGSARTVVLIRDVSQRRRELVAQRIVQRQNEFVLDLYRRSEGLDESGVVRRVIDQAAAATGSPLSFLFFVDAPNQTLSLAAWRVRGQAQPVMGEGAPCAFPDGGALGDCLRKKRPATSKIMEAPAALGLPETQQRLVIPVIDGENVVAVLGVANRESAYDEDDQNVLAALGESAWRVLHAKRTHARTLRSYQRIDVALQGMIEALVRVGERHDPYTAGSSRRVAALAVALARELGLDGERQHGLRIAAMLHDAGNIAVPASILAKPGPLTDGERALMRTHVEEGCRLLADIDFGAPVADVVYQSHERWNGGGYPHGLKRDKILLEARILGVADTVEAMCSPRPHRPAVGMQAALEEINRGAGELYDPQVVEACTRLVRDRGFKLD